MTALVLDTHAVLWWSFSPESLSRRAAEALSSAELLLLPAIVFWETALLVRKRRLHLAMAPASWLDGLRTLERVQVVPLTADIALRADQLPMHDDPADRFIVATALRHGVPLVTKDNLIHDAKIVRTVW